MQKTKLQNIPLRRGRNALLDYSQPYSVVSSDTIYPAASTYQDPAILGIFIEGIKGPTTAEPPSRKVVVLGFTAGRPW